MARIFAVISVMAIVMIFISGMTIYWLSASKIETANNTAIQTIAQGFATTLTAQLNQINQALDKYAQDETLINAINQGDAAKIKQTAEHLQRYMPHAQIFRILLPGVNEIDDAVVPHMGYADLDLVKETFKQHQFPVIQGAKGANRHLAIARQIRYEDKVIAVLLASLDYKFLIKSVDKFVINDGLLELKQGQLMLNDTGSKDSKQAGDSATLTVADSSWTVEYWASVSGGFISLWTVFGIIAIPALIAGLVLLIFYRKLLQMLRTDQSTLLKAVKDLMTGKPQGNYPVVFDEMRVIITTLVQFKRVLDKGDVDLGAEAGDDDLDIDGFFDDMGDIDSIQSSQDSDVAEIEGYSTAPVVIEEPEIIQVDNPAEFLSSEDTLNHDEAASIFRAYDIRGIADKTLSKDVVYNIGRAIGSEAKDQGVKKVVIARDGRLSSPALIESLTQGIMTTGRDVLDIGRVPTPILYFVTQHTEGKTGVMLTGSHNPAEYNGLKIVISGETLSGEKIQQLKNRIDTENFATGEPGLLQENNSIINEYIGTIADDLHLVRPMKVVLDCGNGVAGELAPILLKTLGCEVIELYCEIDGNFPNHHPDPSNPDNLVDLIKAVQHHEADVGFAFDGDGDRLGVVDSKGKIIWADRQMMLFAKDVLAQKPGAEIIFDVKCSSHLPAQIAKYGGRSVMWKTGHSFIKAKLKETGAILAGEMSGHIFFNDRWFGFDDGLYAAARMIEILSSDTRSSSEVFADFPDSINTPELNIDLQEGENVTVLQQIIEQADFADGKIIDIDGMRVEFADGWGLVRASNTIPALVLRFEADTQDAMERIQSDFKQLLNKINPDMVLPF